MGYGKCVIPDCYSRGRTRGMCAKHRAEALADGTYEQVARPDGRIPKRRSQFVRPVELDQQRHRLVTYGMTEDEYQARLAEQDNCCAICDDLLDRPVVDHCHALGHVRGLLCHGCNVGLGFFRDRPKALRKAARYLIANQYPPS